MESSKATVNVYDYSEKKKRGPFHAIGIIISRIVSFIFTVCVIGLVGYTVFMYFINQEVINDMEKMVTYSAMNLSGYISRNGINDYKVINFPDEENIVSANGKIYNDLGMDLDQFESGYMIMYQDNSYSFELTYKNYCLTKGASDSKYSVHIFRKCKTKFE